MLIISRRSLLSLTLLVDCIAPQSELLSVTQTIGRFSVLACPVVSSANNVAKKIPLSIPLAMASVSAANVLRTTLLIFLDCHDNGEKRPFCTMRTIRCPRVLPSERLPSEESLNITIFRLSSQPNA